MRNSLVSLLALAGVGTLALALPPQDDAAAAQDAPPMAMEPTAVHKLLLSHAGEWVGTIEASYPGMPPMKSEATETVTAFGFHTVSNFHSSFMGMPYKGIGVLGYDPASDTAHGTWTDNVNTYTNVMKGKVDLEKKTADMIYEAPKPDGSGPVRHRNHMQFGDKEYSIDFYMGEEGEEMHFMRLAMKRK